MSVRKRNRLSDDHDAYVSGEAVNSIPVTIRSDGESDDANGNDVKSSANSKKRINQRDIELQSYRYINERIVEDVTIEFFYKPHTISVLVAICTLLLGATFICSSEDIEKNVCNGFLATILLFLVISALAFPNGPFIRPHPVIWRIVFGLSVIYVLVLQFVLFQSYKDIKAYLKWLDPVSLSKEKLDDKEYGANCSDITLHRLWNTMDLFVIAHFFGWLMKAILIRHSIICWYISISWELTEVLFTHLLPNFNECWWDSIILDVIICNGLGIYAGTKIANFFEIRKHHWESIKDIKTKRGKFKRAVLQFTPESWMRVDWYNNCVLRRTLSIYTLVMLWLVLELNTFFLKHVFAIDSSHPLVFWRLVLLTSISAPAVRQSYMFVTDPKVTRIGMHCWIYFAICALESAICIKFGHHTLPPVKLSLIACWIAFMAMGTFGCVWLSVSSVRVLQGTESVSVDGCVRQCYIDSSCENLGLIADDVAARRKMFKISFS